MWVPAFVSRAQWIIRRSRAVRRVLVSLASCAMMGCGASSAPPPRHSAQATRGETAAHAAAAGSGRDEIPKPVVSQTTRARPSAEGASRERLAAGDPRELTERARAQLLELGQSGFSDMRTSAANVLDTLAALTASLDVEQQLKVGVSEIRFQAKRLHRTDSFVRAGWIARALNAALDGLERLECSQQLEAWLRAARRSVDVIDDRTTLAFQQAPVQDAFRATVDAFGAAIEPGTSCDL